MRYVSRNKKLNRQPSTVKNWIYHRGDIYLAKLNPFKGSEQGGTRPVLVLSNDIGSYSSSLITIAPITSQLKKTQQPTHVTLDMFGKDVATYCCDMENFRAEVDVVPGSVFYSWVFGFGGDVVINKPAKKKSICSWC